MASFRWHHADRVLRTITAHPGSDAKELAAGETNLEASYAYYLKTARAPQYVGADLKRAPEFELVLAGVFRFFKDSADDQKVLLTSVAAKDPICQNCILHHGQQAHCFTDNEIDEKVKLENKVARPFQAWIEAEQDRLTLARFDEKLLEPGQTVPSIVGKTCVGALKCYYLATMFGAQGYADLSTEDLRYPETVPYNLLIIDQQG